MRIRPEATQAKRLSGAPPHSRVDSWPHPQRLDQAEKNMPGDKYSSLLVLNIGDEEKNEYNADTWENCYKTFLSVIYTFL